MVARMIRSIIAVIAGLVFILFTHVVTDDAMHASGVFPPENQPMVDPWLYADRLDHPASFKVAQEPARRSRHQPLGAAYFSELL